MKIAVKHLPGLGYGANEKNVYGLIKLQYEVIKKGIIVLAMSIFFMNNLYAQSGSWNGWREFANGAIVTNGSGGYQDHGNGVIQLTDSLPSGCTASSVYSGAVYNHCDSSFSECYQVVFGCDDDGADGMAFSFSYGCPMASSWQLWGCGGGLGYYNACAWNKAVTIEFDTYNNAGVDGFDGSYEGTGTQDEVVIHRNLNATDGGKVAGVAVPNLEDGQEHTVCISYDISTEVLSVSIDGSTVITRDLTGDGLGFSTYYDPGNPDQCNLQTVWSGGTNAGVNQQIVSDGADISQQAGSVCPQILPVDFINVSAEVAGAAVNVFWSTATETFNEKFIVERSTNLVVWQQVGEVSGAGNATGVNTYSFFDYAPLNGTGYYRIRQVDFDGAFAFSNVVAVTREDNSVTITPNPFMQAFTINSDLAGEMDIKIHDITGRLVYTASRENNDGEVSIRPELPAGAYIITIQTPSHVEQQKISRK